MSATGLLKTAWSEAFKRPGMLVLAFWYLFIAVFFEYFTLTHLGAGFSAWMRQVALHGAIGRLPSGLGLKLELTGLTFFLIILPFTWGGLYGGVATALKSDAPAVGLFFFFRQAVRHFWMSLGLITAALVATLILSIPAYLLLVVSSTSIVFGIVIRLILLIAALEWLSAILFWQGAAYLGETPVLAALWQALRWLWHDLWFAFRLMVLLIGLFVAAVLVLEVLAVIPGLGPLLSLVASGIINTVLATFAMVLYRAGAGRA